MAKSHRDAEDETIITADVDDVQGLSKRVADDYKTVYCNSVSVIGTPADFQFIIYDIVRDWDDEDVREAKIRVVMSPQQAWQFSRVLEDAIKSWMQTHLTPSEQDESEQDE